MPHPDLRPHLTVTCISLCPDFVVNQYTCHVGCEPTHAGGPHLSNHLYKDPVPQHRPLLERQSGESGAGEPGPALRAGRTRWSADREASRAPSRVPACGLDSHSGPDWNILLVQPHHRASRGALPGSGLVHLRTCAQSFPGASPNCRIPTPEVCCSVRALEATSPGGMSEGVSQLHGRTDRFLS